MLISEPPSASWQAGVEQERGKCQEEQAAEQVQAAGEAWEGMQQTSELPGEKADGGEDYDGLQSENDAKQRQLQLWRGVARTHEGGQEGEEKDGDFRIGGVGEKPAEEIAFLECGWRRRRLCLTGGAAYGSSEGTADGVRAEPCKVAATEQFHGGVGSGRGAEKGSGAEHCGGGVQQTTHPATHTEVDCGSPASGESEADGGQHIGAGGDGEQAGCGEEGEELAGLQHDTGLPSDLAASVNDSQRGLYQSSGFGGPQDGIAEGRGISDPGKDQQRLTVGGFEPQVGGSVEVLAGLCMDFHVVDGRQFCGGSLLNAQSGANLHGTIGEHVAGAEQSEEEQQRTQWCQWKTKDHVGQLNAEQSYRDGIHQHADETSE